MLDKLIDVAIAVAIIDLTVIFAWNMAINRGLL